MTRSHPLYLVMAIAVALGLQWAVARKLRKASAMLSDDPPKDDI